MANVNKKTKSESVHSHIKGSTDFINKYLPTRYVGLVQEKLRFLNLTPASSGTIRNVRNKFGQGEYLNIPVITAMLEVSKENKAAQDALIKASNEINALVDESDE